MPKRILIIEDEEILLDLLQNKLEKSGYEVMAARDGMEGLSAMEKEKPDLILLDILMPVMNGMEVLKIMHRNKILSEIPVIILSNSGQEVEVDEAVKLGAKDYLIKAEFDPDEVLEKVKKQLSEDPMPNEEKLPTESTRILLVEDDKFLRDLISQKLIKEGFNLSVAIDGEEGLKKTLEEKPQLVLLDIILPGIDGFEVLSKIRANAETAKTPVILLSNLGAKDDVERGLQLGADDYMIKAHFTPGEIIAKVKNIIQLKHS
ncbi:MAG: response regulator [Parcubacteria group bacterium]|nr:response regulator [Parcubacteria group bacterium]